MQTMEQTRTEPATAEDLQTASQAKANAAKLHPKEHGAYAILGVPIGSALVMGGPTLVGIVVAVAAVAGFLAHEPLLVAWGHRGRRAQTSTPAAKSRLTILLSITIVSGVIALALGTQVVRLALTACLAMAVASFVLAATGKHRTLCGQMWGVVALSAACVPILLAGDVSVAASLTIWAAWLLGFSASTIAVRSVIAAQKRQPRTVHVSILAAISLLIGIAAMLSIYWPLATLPMTGLSWYLIVSPPRPIHLKRVGWTLVVSTLATALLMIQNVPA
jgi:hypothetical protein